MARVSKSRSRAITPQAKPGLLGGLFGKKNADKDKSAPELATYLWQGTDKRGDHRQGELKAESLSVARSELIRQGFSVDKLKKKRKSLRAAKITTADISMFSRQLATMFASGVPLVQGLGLVAQSTENPALSRLMMTLRADVEGGTHFAEALKKHPQYFDSLFCSLVEAGEHAGVLEQLLDKIATYQEKSESLKGKIKKAMFYPTAVMVVAGAVTAGILMFVVPQFQEMFASFGSQLPAFTQLIVNASDSLRDNALIYLAGLAGGIWSLRQGMRRSHRLQRFKDRVMLGFPVIGRIFTYAAVARFARTTSTMFAAGVPLVDAMTSVAEVAGNSYYRSAILRIREDLATGYPLQLALRQSGRFPPMLIQMVAIGEESGAVDDMLSKVAAYYEEQVDNAVDALSSLLEPMIMVVIGVVVGGLVVGMYLPIFKMGEAMG